MTTVQKVQMMHRKFGKDEEHICRDCQHRIVYEFGKSYAKCVVFGDNRSPNTDWGSWCMACGLFNKDTELRDVFLDDNGRIVFAKTPRREHFEQEETLF